MSSGADTIAQGLVMAERALDFQYDSRSSTLEVYGVVDHATWPRVREAVDQAFRSSPCRLTVDLTGVDRLPAHLLGRLVHLCNTQYPGTLIRLPARRTSPAAVERLAASA